VFRGVYAVYQTHEKGSRDFFTSSKIQDERSVGSINGKDGLRRMPASSGRIPVAPQAPIH
jgi:hypothetical protein